MAYKQSFGLSRSKSPLNNEEKSLYDKNFPNAQKLTGRQRSLIDLNNEKAKNELSTSKKVTNQLSTNTDKFLAPKPGVNVLGSAKKELLKKGLKTGILGKTLRTGAKIASRINPAALLAEALLSPMKAYGGGQKQSFEFDDFKEDLKKEKRLNRIQGMTKKQISESDAMYNLKNKPVYGKPPSQLKQGR